MDLIGQQETARRERDARMAKATADQEAAVREAESQQIKLNAQRDVSLRQAEVEALTQAAEAKAAQSGPLAQAEATQEVVREADRARPARGRPEAEGAHRVDDPARRGRRRRPGQARRGREAVEDRGGPGGRGAGPARRPGRRRDPGHEGRGQRPRHRGQRRGDGQADHPRGQRRGGHRPVQGRGGGEGLALRADAYRQFNEAAVIQTVLSMLPEIVRAAAEPMGRIDSLTVLSNDGASELVKNTTRTVTEASATVKGLTGIDVPALIGSSMGARFGGTEPEPEAPAGGGGGGRSGGGGTSGSGGGEADRREDPEGAAVVADDGRAGIVVGRVEREASLCGPTPRRRCPPPSRGSIATRIGHAEPSTARSGSPRPRAAGRRRPSASLAEIDPRRGRLGPPTT